MQIFRIAPLAASLLLAIPYGVGQAQEESPSAPVPTALSDMPAGVYDLDETHASLTWKVSHLGLSMYTARFTDFDAKITLVPDNLAASQVSAVIEVDSLETDYPYPEEKDFDAKLINDENWFNEDVFPEISFESTSIQITGENTGVIYGDMTMLGVTQPMTLNVTFNGAMPEHPFSGDPVMGFSASGTIQRSAFGMNTHIPSIGDDVTFMIEAEFIQDLEEREDDDESKDAADRADQASSEGDNSTY